MLVDHFETNEMVGFCMEMANTSGKNIGMFLVQYSTPFQDGVSLVSDVYRYAERFYLVI